MFPGLSIKLKKPLKLLIVPIPVFDSKIFTFSNAFPVFSFKIFPVNKTNCALPVDGNNTKSNKRLKINIVFMYKMANCF
jgi:hypothetical protein